MTALSLIVGLGNPGPAYQNTRHNVGQWFVEHIIEKHAATIKAETKMYGKVALVNHHQHSFRCLIADDYMNNSGKSVQAISQFYKIPIERILVVHDELDLAPGVVRLKQGGSHGGHNGLRDIISRLGNRNAFNRLRLGIGRPDHSSQVSQYVLQKPSSQETDTLWQAIHRAYAQLGNILDGNWQQAMKTLHTTPS